MTILITGNRGLVGRALEKTLSQAGHHPIGFDLKDGWDILSPSQLAQAMRGCDAAVHLAAIETKDSLQTLRTNVLGTLNVLEACVESKIRRLVFMSSIDALGIFQGEGIPLYLPLDDGYPCHPTLVYSVSKKLGEELCERFAEEEKLRIATFRVPGVWTTETYRIIQSKRRENPEYEWSPYWEYGAFIDVRDLAAAVLRAIEKDLPGYTCLSLASDDITSSGRTSLQLVRALHPAVPWKGGPEYEDDPYRSLIDCGTAKRLLDWRPEHSWKSFIASASGQNPAGTCSK